MAEDFSRPAGDVRDIRPGAALTDADLASLRAAVAGEGDGFREASGRDVADAMLGEVDRLRRLLAGAYEDCAYVAEGYYEQGGARVARAIRARAKELEDAKAASR